MPVPLAPKPNRLTGQCVTSSKEARFGSSPIAEQQAVTRDESDEVRKRFFDGIEIFKNVGVIESRLLTMPISAGNG